MKRIMTLLVSVMTACCLMAGLSVAVAAPAQASARVAASSVDTPDGSSVTVIGQSTVSSSAEWKGTLVSWWVIKHTKKQKQKIKRGKCITTDGWNYYSKTDLSKGRHWDKNMRLCKDKKSPTGWIKIGGGKSGSACWNPATPVGHKPIKHIPVIPGPITEVRSFNHFFGSATARSLVYLEVTKVCDGATVKTRLEAWGVANAVGLLELARKTKGRFTSFSQGLKAALQASAKSSSEVKLFIKCTPSPNPPPPPPPPVMGGIICKNPPHLSAPGGNGIMVCELSRSDGVKPTLSQFSVEEQNGYAYFAQATEFGWREEAQVNPCPSNVLCVRVQVWAVSPGLFKYRYRYGQQDWVNGQFNIVSDDF